MSEGLKQLRSSMRMTQEELAEKMNVSRQTIAKWENGESVPDVVRCSELSKIFNLSLDEIASFFIKNEKGKQYNPKNKFFFDKCVVDNNHIVLSDSTLKQFNLNNGDEILLLGDTSRGLAFVSKTGFAALVSQLLDSAFVGTGLDSVKESSYSDNCLDKS